MRGLVLRTWVLRGGMQKSETGQRGDEVLWRGNGRTEGRC